MNVIVIHAQRMVLYVKTRLDLTLALVLKNSITMETNVMVLKTMLNHLNVTSCILSIFT